MAGKDSIESDPRAGVRVHPVVTAVNDRVQYILGLMAEGVWTRDTTRDLQEVLATTWGVAESTIRNYSAEAGRMQLDAVKLRRAEVADVAINTLLDIATSDWKMPGDKSAAKGAADSLLMFAGLDKPDEDKIQKHVFAGVSDQTPERAREIMKGLFGDVVPHANPDLDEPGKS